MADRGRFKGFRVAGTALFAAALSTMLVGRPARAADDAPSQTESLPELGLRAAPAAPAQDPPTLVAAPTETLEAVPEGFYRDRQGRVMQVSFDFGRRLWLGVGYAPRLRTTGVTEVSPAAFDFGVAWDELSGSGRTRQRYRLLDGQVRMHAFGLDVTGFSYDLSHRYQHPLLRVTTFVGEPERHDFYLNVGLYTELLHFVSTPRGVSGEQELTLGSLQATLDLWQSADLRSYVRIRTGPGVQVRFGPWGDETRYVGFLPQGVLEGNFIIGRRALQQLSFKARGNFLRSVSWGIPGQIEGGWLADGEAAYEAILLAINDQPVSFRVAAQAGVRGDAISMVDGPAVTSPVAPGWEWKGTAGFRMSFFSPPVRR